MSFFNNYEKEGKGISKDADSRLRIIVFFDILFRKFWNLILINLIYILFCLPIVTIGPATAGVTKLLRNYAREEHAFLWSDFIETFKQNFKKSVAVFFIDLVACILLLFDLYMYTALNAPSILRITALAALMLTGTILLFMNYYIFTMMVTFDLNFKQLIKNAFLFAWIGFWRNILITILIAAIVYFIVIAYFPTIGIFFVVFLLFSLCGLIINFITYPLIKKYMIDGYDPKTGEKLTD